MGETQRRRDIQTRYNQEHGIVPKTIVKSVRELLEISAPVQEKSRGGVLTDKERRAEIQRLEKEMKKAAAMLEFEYAAALRDQLIQLRGQGKQS